MPLAAALLARQPLRTTRAATQERQPPDLREHRASGQPFGDRFARAARRYRQAAFALALVIVALFLAVFGAAWYASDRLMAIVRVHDIYPLRVVAGYTQRGTVILDHGPDATEPGSFRLAWHGGQAIVGPVLSSTHGTVTRRISNVYGRLVPGTKVGIEPDLYTGDPRTALRFEFSTVSVPTHLGGMPAWYLPGRRSTWVILIHGLGGSRTDTLPAMPILHALGFPMLAISYRNDADAPQSGDRHSHLGGIEWHDVAAAVKYALSQGASGVALYGYSLGGSMALIVARDPGISAHVRAVVLDSPLLDWPATIDYAARRRGILGAFAALTETVLAWRAHIDYAHLDQLEHEDQLRAPVLLFQGSNDTVVPPDLAARFAHNRPGLVTYVSIAGADHASAIDTAPSVYKAALRRFLAGLP